MYSQLVNAIVWAIRGGGLVLCGAVVWFIAGRCVQDWPSATAAIVNFLAWPGLFKSLCLTLFTGMASSFLALFITKSLLASAYARGRLGAFARGLARLLTPVLAVPHAAFAIGLSLLVWPGGVLARWLSPWATGWTRPPDWAIVGDSAGIGLLLGLALRELPFLLLTAFAIVRTMDVTGTLDAGRALGLDARQAFARLVWPQLWPRLRMPFVLVLGYGLTNVDMALILGPNTPPTLGVWLLGLFGDPSPMASDQVAVASACLALLAVGGIALSLLIIELAMLGSGKLAWLGPWGTATRVAAIGSMGIGIAFALLVALSWALGFIATALFAAAKRWRFPDPLPAFSLDTWARLSQDLIAAIGHTLGLGLAAAGISVLLAIGLLEKLAQRHHKDLSQAWRLGLYLPLVMPQLLAVLALYFAVLSLGGGVHWTWVLAAHTIYGFCFVALLLAPTWLGFDPDMLHQAQSLGLGPWQRLVRIKLPHFAGPILFAIVLAMTVSFALYLPTLVLSGGRMDTLLTEGVHFAANLRRPQMAVFALVQTTLSLALLASAWGLIRKIEGARA